MKKTLLTISIMAGLMMTACVKESANEQMGLPEGAMMLTTEGFQGHNTKTSVSGTSVQWVGDGTEKVYLNGNEYTVGLTGGNAYVTASDADKTGETYGYTGLEGTPTWTSGTKTLSVSVPAEYTSSYSGGRQVIALPMVAYKDATADKIEFKHVTAAVKVRIKNTVGEAVYLDKVVVKSAGKKLNGDVDVVLTNVDGMSTQTTSTASEKQVTVYFAFNTVTINNYNDNDANIKEVQVPILPLEASDLTVEVYTHKMVDHSSDNSGLLSVSYSYNFSGTKNVAQDIERNVMLTAGVNIQTHTVSPTTMNEVDHSLFSVSAGTKVRFSKGNLKCTKTGDTWSDGYTWSFLDNQYNTVESASQTVGTNYANTSVIGLFGWGTSGWNSGATAYQPFATSMTNTEYYSGNLSGTNTDWGVYNTISNGGTGWRTLESSTTARQGEWYYLIGNNGGTCRETTNTLSSNARFIYAQIDGMYLGVIIFPDDYLHPVDADYMKNTGVYNNCNSSSGMATVGLVGWSKMEASGAVFLPITYTRGGTSVSIYASGSYWSSTKSDDVNAYRFNFTQTSMNTRYSDNMYRGCAVRLVKNAN